jgi:hypothetical protein
MKAPECRTANNRPIQKAKAPGGVALTGRCNLPACGPSRFPALHLLELDLRARVRSASLAMAVGGRPLEMPSLTGFGAPHPTWSLASLSGPASETTSRAPP